MKIIYLSIYLGNNMMSTCKLGPFWPDGGQKMAWLQVNSGTLSLRPYPHISLVFWKRRFFPLLSKQSVPTGCFFFQWLKVAPSLMGTMHLFSLVSKSENNDTNFLKPPLYTVQQSSIFSNILSGKLLERMNFQWHFSLDTCWR